MSIQSDISRERFHNILRTQHSAKYVSCRISQVVTKVRKAHLFSLHGSAETGPFWHAHISSSETSFFSTALVISTSGSAEKLGSFLRRVLCLLLQAAQSFSCTTCCSHLADWRKTPVSIYRGLSGNNSVLAELSRQSDASLLVSTDRNTGRVQLQLRA